MTDASNEVVLLPCPFCGGEWGLGQEPDDNYPFQSMWYLYHKSPRCFWNWSPPHFANRDAAVFAWNHRIAHSDPRPVAEGLREALVGLCSAYVALDTEGHRHAAGSWYQHARTTLATHSPAPMAGEEACPVCNGDCGSANPPVMFCPMRDMPAPHSPTPVMIPAGYVLVPVEPTEAMIQAVWKATLGGSLLAAERAARAMIAAAHPSTQEGADRG